MLWSVSGHCLTWSPQLCALLQRHAIRSESVVVFCVCSLTGASGSPREPRVVPKEETESRSH